MFEEKTAKEVVAVAREFGLEPAALLAIVEVESGGQALAIVGGRPEPLIRFEGHYFDRRLSETNRVLARAEGLASPQAGAIANPATQAARWRMLARASEFDRKAAHESVSWGLGQVMGSHWEWLGFGSVEELVAEARSGVAGQVRLMARYIDKAGLAAAIGQRDWEAFALGYNGPGYRTYSYDEKIAAAYRRHGGTDSLPVRRRTGVSDLLRRGSTGEAVRDLQQCLSALGYPVAADGIFGKDTERAVLAFQQDHDLSADGIVGPATFAAIAEAMPFRIRANGFWMSLYVWLATAFGRM